MSSPIVKSRTLRSGDKIALYSENVTYDNMVQRPTIGMHGLMGAGVEIESASVGGCVCSLERCAEEDEGALCIILFRLVWSAGKEPLWLL